MNRTLAPGLFPVALFAAILCGGICVTGFAPFGWWPVLVLAQAVFFSLLFQAPSKRRATIIGYGFGFGLFAIGVHWVYYSLHLFGAAIAPVSALGTFLFVALLAIVPAVFARFVWRASHHGRPWPWFLLWAPALWLFMEWIKTWLFTGFPWLNFGYGTIHTPLAGYVPVGGVLLASLMVAVSAGAIGLFLCVRNLRAIATAVVTLTIIWGGGFGLNKLQWTQPYGGEVSVTMVQGNIAQEVKFLPNLLRDSLSVYSSMSGSGADLIIWPETAVPTFFSDVDDYLNDFAAAMARSGSVIMTGGFIRDAERGEYYNSIKVLGGTEQQVYSKRHLVPFGEFIPFRFLLNRFSDLIMIPMSDLSAGRGPVAPIEIDGVSYGMSICYEDAFGNEMRKQLPQANVLVNISNDAWFGDSMAPHQHLEMAAMRALEFHRPMLRVTNTGITAHVSERGEIVASAEQFQQDAISVSLVPRQGATPYVHVGDWLVLGLAMLLFLLSLGLFRFQRKSAQHVSANPSI